MKTAAIIAAALLGLVACGGDGESDPDDPAVSDGSLSERWTTITDPVTSKTYRCYSYYVDGGYDGGPALFCDELTP